MSSQFHLALSSHGKGLRVSGTRSLQPPLRSFSPSTSEKEICVLADLGEKILAQVKAVKQVDKDICIHRVVIKEQLDNTELEYAALLLKTILCRENNVFWMKNEANP